jgi:hypothetical protein
MCGQTNTCEELTQAVFYFDEEKKEGLELSTP